MRNINWTENNTDLKFQDCDVKPQRYQGEGFVK